ncbi:MAG: hypothetical protein H7249_14960 [Chitinophagaceae bacterium]|nr:hypothetical protein [Oligoflexus sp.]
MMNSTKKPVYLAIGLFGILIACSDAPKYTYAGSTTGVQDSTVGDVTPPDPLPSQTDGVSPMATSPSPVVKPPSPSVATAPSAPAPAPVIAVVSSEGDGDFPIGPTFTRDPLMDAQASVDKGKLSSFKMDSKDSKVYVGTETDRGLTSPKLFSRDGWIYTPAHYVEGTELPFMVIQDGGGYQYVKDVVDNLVAAKKIPKMILVFINPGPGDGMGSERGLEYDTVSTTYINFVETELLPKLQTDFKVKFTSNPEGRATMGGSSGAAAALTMAWLRNDLYHRVLSYSGTFVAQHPDSTYPSGAWEYHSDLNLIKTAEKKNLRIYIEVGTNDNNFGGNRDWIEANKRTAAALAAKGYHYRFNLAQGAGHVDGKVISQTLPTALVWLWRGYPID